MKNKLLILLIILFLSGCTTFIEPSTIQNSVNTKTYRVVCLSCHKPYLVNAPTDLNIHPGWKFRCPFCHHWSNPQAAINEYLEFTERYKPKVK